MLECADDWARVTFPVAPRWVYFLPIVGGITAGLLELVVGADAIFVVLHLNAVPGHTNVSSRQLLLHLFAPTGITVLFWWASAVYLFWMYRRWGRVPRILVASADVLTLTRLQWWRIRQRRVPAEEITRIELRSLKPLFGRRAFANLRIYRKRCLPLLFRLSSVDPQLPRQIAEALAQKLNRPLTS